MACHRLSPAPKGAQPFELLRNGVGRWHVGPTAAGKYSDGGATTRTPTAGLLRRRALTQAYKVKSPPPPLPGGGVGEAARTPAKKSRCRRADFLCRRADQGVDTVFKVSLARPVSRGCALRGCCPVAWSATGWIAYCAFWLDGIRLMARFEAQG